MPKIWLILFIVLGLMGIGEKGFGQYLYKWVDEKGTVHFSDDPPPQTSVKEEKKPSTENTAKILKKLEYGNRDIPDDMKKYGREAVEPFKPVEDKEEAHQADQLRFAGLDV
jgi:hypothetical protein